MTKKPKIFIDMNDKSQLDLFGNEEIPVPDEIKEVIDAFKNPPASFVEDSSASEKAPHEQLHQSLKDSRA